MRPHAIITGASSGLGLESAHALALLGYNLTLIARREERLVTLGNQLRELNPELKVTEVVLDISNLDMIRNFAKTVLEPVDVLMNNAGLMGPDFKLSVDGIESQMATNHIGHFALTNGLWSVLNKAQNPKVISLSSVVHRKGNLKTASVEEVRGANEAQYNRWQRYADSKLACLFFARELDLRAALSGSKVASIAAHPGWAVTGLQENFPHVLDPFAQTAKQGARSQVWAATDDSLKSGDFVGPRFELWGNPKKLKGSTRSFNREIARQLWESSEELTGAKFLA